MDDIVSKRIPKLASDEVLEKIQEKIREIDIKQKEDITVAKAKFNRVPYMNLVNFPISPEILSLIEEQTSKKLEAICFFAGGSGIRIGSTNPLNEELIELAKKIEKDHRTEVKIYLISKRSFEFAFQLYRSVPKIRKFVAGVEITEEEIKKYEAEIRTFKDLEEKLEEVSVTDILTLVMAAAIKARSSDIHIEAEEKDIKIRFRIDGILHDAASIDTKLWPKIVTRVKLVSGLKINISDRPQDGRFTIFLSQEKIDVRVSTLPTAYGESVVMRLLMSSAIGLSFEDLGLRGKAFEILKMEVTKPNGMIITTGPTGSGKTTTLYAVLNKLNDPGTKIITIEDPVEYKLEGINQSQIDHSKGYTFAHGLRNILRQDPDIVMVGEIRDLETAEVSINASLTGHLVISTLHTNDAAGSIPRLLAMSVKPFLLAPAINVMIGQRLVRRICQNCKQKAELDNQTISRVMKILSEIPENSGTKISSDALKKIQFYKGGGCEVCQGIGYKGRVGIYEVMTMNKKIEDLILQAHVSEYDMRAIARENGMITMIQDGLLKAVDGITTVDEVFRVAKDITSKL